MKTKHILSTAAVVAALISGAALTTTQTANAQSSTQAVTQKASVDTIEIGSVHFEHYNVLRVELKTPISASDYIIALAIEGMHHQGTPVKENGKYIGFDMNMDELVKKYPTAAEREELFDALFIRCFSMTGSRPVTSKVTNQTLKNELLSYKYAGEILRDGYAAKASNVIKGSSYKQFIAKEAYGDHTLEDGRMTTKTGGLQFKLKPAVVADYSYQVIDASGKEAGKAWVHEDDLFINTFEAEHFLPKEYTVTVKSNQTGKVYTIAKFTPTNIF
ncbi:hypothetical protein DOK67_0000659 [Enterococcus sp. DIV0212c]|uniref:hypothetical protein n=1 Tax=Enterococcus sp. DIV0212c TaxID=2230867 RepID=UPI001A9B3E57|nr:hypothetical protein [Enterococcus sp. DIV0212c]MBO1354691.1 hypothetical protein [Enterococcus sp. DIV0212c]